MAHSPSPSSRTAARQPTALSSIAIVAMKGPLTTGPMQASPSARPRSLWNQFTMAVGQEIPWEAPLAPKEITRKAP